MVETFLNFGDKVDRTINGAIGIIAIVIFILVVAKKLFNYYKKYDLEYKVDKFFFFSLNKIPSRYIRRGITNLLNIKPKVIILLPISSERNFKHLGYQLNGINRYFTRNLECKDNTTIFFIDNTDSDSTIKDINKLKKYLHKNQRYIIIATMSDIFNTLSKEFAQELTDNYRKHMIKIIGTLASRTNIYSDYKYIESLIRLSPPDFDEAKKASLNIFSKLVSNYCPNSGCKFNLNNKVVVISSNAYGDAVKESLDTIIKDIQNELDKNTGFCVDGNSLKSSLTSNNYKFNGKEIKADPIKNKDNSKNKSIELTELLNQKDKTIFYFFIIGYEPNISKILKQLDSMLCNSKCSECTYNILISATASVQEWQENIYYTINDLKSIDKIEEINYLKIKYPEFKNITSYNKKEIACKFYSLNNEYKKSPVKFSDINHNKEIRETINRDDINYINGFMIMSLEFAQMLMERWDENLTTIKQELYNKYSSDSDENRDIIGIKILNSGDSIDHFTIKTLYKKPQNS